MTFTAKDIIRSVSRVLFDEDHVRWPLPELLDHINDAVRTIVSIKPNSRTETRTLTLQAGTLQELPDECEILARVIRNIVTAHDEPGGPVGGQAIRMLPSSARDLMDGFFPGWQSSESMFGPVVQHVIYDPADLKRFYVIPGNDGTGKIEAIVGVQPAPLAAIGDQNALETYATLEIPLPEKYRTPVADYVAYRAFSKDQGVPASAARAQERFAAFQNAMGATASAEGDISAATAAAGKGS